MPPYITVLRSCGFGHCPHLVAMWAS